MVDTSRHAHLHLYEKILPVLMLITADSAESTEAYVVL
jgi:hypothetical protein